MSRSQPVTDERDRLDWETWRLGIVIVFGAFASQLDVSVVNVAVDAIGRDLDASLTEVQWVATAYLVALAMALPACGWLGRRVGVGRLWLASLAAFTAASALCALAPSAGWLIAVRVLQGLTAGLLVPAGQTILGQAVGPQRLGRVMGTLGTALSAAPALGPVVGGLVVDGLSWRWIFLVNLPIGAAGLALGARYVPRERQARAARLDWPGLALLAAGLPLLLYAITGAGERTALASVDMLVPLAAGAAALALYVAHASRTDQPLIDLRLNRNREYLAANAGAALGGACLFGGALLLPLYFEIARGQEALGAGLSLVGLGLGTGLVMPIAGRLTDRHGGGVVATMGAAASLATTLPFVALDAGSSPLAIEALLLLRGMAVGLTLMPLTTAAYAAVKPEELPDATTQFNIVLRVGGAIGGAVFAVVVARELSAGAEHAFQAAFGWLTGASLLALAAALWLWHAGGHRPRRPAGAGRTPRTMGSATEP
jgi:EmrB/QacA subfamily drug resistance transporter